MGLKILTIARNTFIEALRQPIYLFLILSCAVLLVLVTWSTGFSMGYSTSAEVDKDNRLLLEVGLSTVFAISTLLAAFIATATVSREIENRTALTVVSKPIGRSSIILGKYLGVTLAILLAAGVMMIFLLLAIRHGVLTTAADEPDQPVIVFSVTAIVLSLGLGAWCNFFYGWSFAQTTSLALIPLIGVAYLLVLWLGKEWQVQSLGADFKPRVVLACATMLLAILVLTAIATAASTRLGQVMTIVVAAGVFVLGLVSNEFLGERAFQNEPVAFISEATPSLPSHEGLSLPGHTYNVTLENAVLEDQREFRAGDPFYYGPNANGLGLAVAPMPGIDPADLPLSEAQIEALERAIIVTEVDNQRLTVRQVGERAIPVRRPPRSGDALFREPTRMRPGPLIAWGVIPNMHHFWLIDAVSQNRDIPPSHIGLVLAYTLVLIVASLSVGVALFQRRDMG